MQIGLKLCHPECTHGFPRNQPNDLVFLPDMTQFFFWPEFEGDEHSDKIS